jgi:hypothetical protein
MHALHDTAKKPVQDIFDDWMSLSGTDYSSLKDMDISYESISKLPVPYIF